MNVFTNNSANAAGSRLVRFAPWLAGLAGLAFALAMVTAGLGALESYGVWLFVATPFVMGMATGFVFNRLRPTASPDETMRLVIKVVAAAGIMSVLAAIEGAICVVMALPVAIVVALMGGAAGRGLSRAGSGNAPVAFMLIAVPITAFVEPGSGRRVHEVESAVVIDASPAEVWPHVVSFSDIPEPQDWLFRSGIAYPLRARIEGSGVGAVRYCEFSTGAFVEPITRWEPERRLSFDVVQSPVPMRELSPYANLSPRHLHGYLRSKHGEFRFVDLGDGRTRLEGTTWYEIEMAPEWYWGLWSDYLIHRIHLRVLEHIKQEVEGR